MAMDESATPKHLLKEKSSLPQCKCEFYFRININGYIEKSHSIKKERDFFVESTFQRQLYSILKF
jgi:hypothetical protein